MISNSQENQPINGEQNDEIIDAECELISSETAPVSPIDSLTIEEQEDVFQRSVECAETTENIERKLALTSRQIRAINDRVADRKAKDELPRKERYAVRQIAKLERLTNDLIQLWHQSKSRPQTVITKRYDSNGNLIEKTAKENNAPQLGLIKAIQDLLRLQADITGTASRAPSNVTQNNVHIGQIGIDVAKLDRDELEAMVRAKRIIDQSTIDAK